ncbi:MAG: hydrogenase maturation nickel metallochaperone HypA [Gemmatimonadaceae bacterium]|nr:hydrogenase maturation nickel metallochaperone HypA [Gemmatimonadaceae bacterium]
MHELSLALEIARVLETTIPAPQLPQIITVNLEVGEDAGIEMANLQFCLDALLGQPPFAGATVTVTSVAGGNLRVGYLELDDERTGAAVGAQPHEANDGSSAH